MDVKLYFDCKNHAKTTRIANKIKKGKKSLTYIYRYGIMYIESEEKTKHDKKTNNNNPNNNKRELFSFDQRRRK